LGNLSKSLQYAVRLTAATILHFNARHEENSLTSEEVADADLGGRAQKRRWEGRSCILNSAVATLIPGKGMSAFRIYEAAISEFLVPLSLVAGH
jgi:hypothetical protein